MSESDELLGFALEALDEIDAIVGNGRSEFMASLDRQRALAFCCIAVGSVLKDYTHIANLPARQTAICIIIPRRYHFGIAISEWAQRRTRKAERRGGRLVAMAIRS